MSTPDLILHGHPASTNTRTVRLLLAEKGAVHSLRMPPFGTDGHRDLHPFRKMPALTAGEVHLFESLAIALWADDVLPGPRLVPREEPARAQVISWCSAATDYLYHDVVRDYAFPLMAPSDEVDQVEVDRKGAQARKVLSAFDAQARPWLVGGALSLADLYLGPIVAFLASLPAGAAVLVDYPALVDHLNALRARASWRLTDPGGE
jgi:glutathione S-transferase